MGYENRMKVSPQSVPSVFDVFRILYTNMQGRVWGKSPGTLGVALDTDMSLLTPDGQFGYCMHSMKTLYPAEDAGSLWERPLVVVPTTSILLVRTLGT